MSDCGNLRGEYGFFRVRDCAGGMVGAQKNKQIIIGTFPFQKKLKSEQIIRRYLMTPRRKCRLADSSQKDTDLRQFAQLIIEAINTKGTETKHRKGC